jgi:1-deoxyxylulose-5-phosphate synthase
MEPRRLGSSSIMVSPICLGTATFGVSPDAVQADAVVGAALDSGITFFDTANSYGNQARFDRPGATPAVQRASAEEILGKALRARRDKVIISSKVCEPVGPELDRWGLSREHITEQLEESLRRLGTDYLDVYHAHRPDPETPIDETLASFDDAMSAGKIRAFAISNFSAWETIEALWRAEVNRVAAPVCNQVVYNLVQRRIEADLVPAALRHGFSLTAYSPLAGGLLAGRAARQQSVWGYQRFGHASRVTAGKMAIAEQLDALADETGTPAGTLATAWLLTRPAIASIVIGAETPDQVVQASTAATLDDDEQMKRVDEVGALARLNREGPT